LSPLGQLVTFAASGCFSSKWAMDHADYQKKYEKPYEGGHADFGSDGGVVSKIAPRSADVIDHCRH